MAYMRANFVLKLQEDISSGLRKIIEQTRRFQELARRLGFKELDGADATVRALGRDLGVVNDQLGKTTRQAEAAAGALRRLNGAELASSARRQAAITRQATAAAGRPSGPTIVMPPPGRMQTLMLPAPGSGGALTPYDAPFEERGPIPLNYRRPLGSRLRDAFGSARERFGAANKQIGAAGAAMGGISLAEPIREAAEFDNVLTHIAITAGASADTVRARVAEMSDTYRKMAIDTKTSSHDIAESAQFLITTGIGEEMTNRLLPIIARAATAYNTPMRDAVQGAFSMHEELKIKPEDMQGALSATALAAKQGHFSFADFSSFLPSIAAQAASSGITGREGLNSLLAALETSRRGAGTSGQAATNVQDFLSYINAPIGTHSFSKAGMNLPGIRLAAEKAGQNPLEAVIEAVRRRTTNMTDAQRSTFLGSVFHNQEARIFAQTMLLELDYYRETKRKVGGSSDDTINEDFNKAQNLHTRLTELGEKSSQVTQRVGQGFSWVVPIGSALLGGVIVGMDWLDKHLPGVTQGTLGLAGGMLGLVTLMGALGVVQGPIKAGWGLLIGTADKAGILRMAFRGLGSTIRGVWALMTANPLSAVVVMLAAAAIDIWRHWDRFKIDFDILWSGLKQGGRGFLDFLNGAFDGDLDKARQGMEAMGRGIGRAWRAVWAPGGIMETLMTDFVATLPNWGQQLAVNLGMAMEVGYGVIGKSLQGWKQLFTDFFDAIGKMRMPEMPWPVKPDLANPDSIPQYVPQSFHAPALQAPGQANVQQINWTGTIQVQVDGDAKVNATTDSRNMQIQNGRRGPTLLRA